jgi:uncharacterized RDD family membrane protein YckC
MHGATSPETVIFIVPFASNWFTWFEKKYKTPPPPVYQPLYRFVYRCMCTWISCLSSVFVCLFVCVLYPSIFFLLCFSFYFPICISFILQGEHASSCRHWWGPTLCFHQHMSSTCTTLIFIPYLWFAVLMVVTVNIIVFWNMKPRIVVNVFQNFGGLYYFHPQCRRFLRSTPYQPAVTLEDLYV